MWSQEFKAVALYLNTSKNNPDTWVVYFFFVHGRVGINSLFPHNKEEQFGSNAQPRKVRGPHINPTWAYNGPLHSEANR